MRKFEDIWGTLQETYPQCVSSTMQHVDELMNARRKKWDLLQLKLRSKECKTVEDMVNAHSITVQLHLVYYTNDGNMYYLSKNGKDIDSKGRPHYAITRGTRKDSEGNVIIINPILKNINEACEQLDETGDYHILPADFEAAINDSNTLIFDLTKFTLLNEWGLGSYFLELSTTRYNSFNREKRKLAERVYGKGNHFVENMEMLKENDIKKTLIGILNPKYVKEHAKEGAIGRVSSLNDFSNRSIFYADSNILNDDYLRGVRKE